MLKRDWVFFIFLFWIAIALSQESKFQEGEKLFKEKKYNKAIAIFREILDRLEWDELSAKSALRLGQCYLALEDYQNARKFFNMAIKGEDELKGEAMIGIGLSYMGEKNYDSAIDEFSQVLNQFKSDKLLAYAYYNRGLAFKNKGWFIKALSDFKNAKAKAKGEEELLKAIEAQLADCQQRQEEFKSGEEAYLTRIQNARAMGDMDGCAHLLRELARYCEDWGGYGQGDRL
ncbi:tetratricopeptide repeat protein [bacterium]|nr:tetratricopeptide repeat protein [bacterium]